MRILVLANKLPYPPKDGGSIATLNMLRGLSQAGYEVTCLAQNTSKHYFPLEQIPSDLTASIRMMAVDCDNAIRTWPLIRNLFFSKEPYVAQRFRQRKLSRKLVSLLREESFDLVQLEGPYPGYYIEDIRANSDAKIILRAHNVEHIIWKRKALNERNPVKKGYLKNMSIRLKNFEMRVLKSVDCIVCISPLDLEYFRKEGAQQAAITIPAGLNLESYPFTPLPEEKTIFFIGALDWLPNVEGLNWFLEKVFHPLCREEPGLRFHVAGRNAPASVIRLLKDERISYHGEIEDAKAFMMKYRIMAAPLFTGSGIRIKILEALALGRPVVTTPVGIEGIPATKGNEVVITDDPDDFKNQLINLLNQNDEEQIDLQMGRRLITENFDTFGLSDRLSRFLKEQV